MQQLDFSSIRLSMPLMGNKPGEADHHYDDCYDDNYDNYEDPCRRTGTAGPLGELFDHGCDSASTVFVRLPLLIVSILKSLSAYKIIVSILKS